MLVGLCAAGILGAACESLIIPRDDLKQEFLTWEFGMFLHFNMATFNDREWANGYEDPASFAPDRLDIEQWADAAELAGMRYAVLTVKHTGGWSLWDSEYTDRDVSAFTNYQGGRGDIVRDFVDTFRRRGMKVGLYYLLPGDYAGRFGNTLPSGAPALHGFPPEAQGDYIEFARRQLTELLTQYGPIDLLWIDQARSRYVSKRAWRRIRNHIKSIQPAALVLANDSRQSEDTDIHSYEYPVYKDVSLGFPPEDNVHPAEVSDYIGPSWFWNPTHDKKSLKSVDDIVTMLNRAKERNANYLLNVSPDARGLIPAEVVQRLKEVGERRVH